MGGRDIMKWEELYIILLFLIFFFHIFQNFPSNEILQPNQK